MVLALLCGAPTAAQYFIWDAAPLRDSCYDGSTRPRDRDIKDAQKRAGEAMDRYLGLARAGRDVSGAFMGAIGLKKQRHWLLDGNEVDTKVARDPWAAQLARVEPTAITVGSLPMYYRVQWRAIRSDGTVLGTYDAYLQSSIGGARIFQLNLYSDGAATQPAPMEPFCKVPGDVEQWKLRKSARIR